MVYPLQSANLPNDPDLTEFYRFNRGFSDAEIFSITQLAEGLQLQDGTAGGIVNPEYRRQKITWLSLNDDSAWIYEKVAKMIHEANSTLWGFSLDGMREDFQFGRYGEDDFYGWHLDMGSKPNERGFRKISVVVQLSPSEKFEGGEFNLLTSKDITHVQMDRGDVIIFPSYMLHQVRPISKGERYSLVLWAHGRAFQ